MPDEPIEIELDNAMPWWETLPDGRRVIVLRDEHLGSDGPRVLLILPRRDAWRPAYKLHLAAGKITDEVRAAERGDFHRGGQVIVAPDGPANESGAFRAIPRPLGPLLVQQDPPGWT